MIKKFTIKTMSLLLVAASLFSCQEKTVQQQIPEYAVMVIEEEPVIVKHSFPALISGDTDAEVRSNVSGMIIKKHIVEGDIVKEVAKATRDMKINTFVDEAPVLLIISEKPYSKMAALGAKIKREQI